VLVSELCRGNANEVKGGTKLAIELVLIERNTISVVNATVVQELDLHLALDEVAEMVAIEFSLASNLTQTDVTQAKGSGWVSLDPDDITVAKVQTSNDVLLFRRTYGWWKDIVGAQEAGQNVFIHAMVHLPSGLFTAVNPVMGGFGDSAEYPIVIDVGLFYKVRRPSVTELAGIVARRR